MYGKLLLLAGGEEGWWKAVKGQKMLTCLFQQPCSLGLGGAHHYYYGCLTCVARRSPLRIRMMLHWKFMSSKVGRERMALTHWTLQKHLVLPIELLPGF